MGADTKALRTRIKSVRSTMHLTKAMGLVASSKIRRAGESMRKAADYASALTDMTEVLLACPECGKSPYLRQEGDRTRLIVIAGDRGLAGGYNANVFRMVREFPDAEILPIGKRACERYGKPFVSSETLSGEDAHAWAKTLCADFTAGAYDRLGIVYTRYVSMMTQETAVQFILPLTRPDNPGPVSAVFEPDEATVLQTAVPAYVAGMIAAAVRESFASEVAARRVAMDAAGKNASAMIDELQLRYNRARQSAITQEITEIVAGSGA